jgi:tetratricopeptide (TPR) repeat protein
MHGLGRDHPSVATSLNNLAFLFARQGRYRDAEVLYQRSLAIRENAFGRDHPDVAQSQNNLAEFYLHQARYADALPIIKRTISQGTTNKSIAFQVLVASEARNLITRPQALADSYEIVQRASSSAAANAVSKLAVRFAAGRGELAQLVRRDQDLTAEAESLDKAVAAFVWAVDDAAGKSSRDQMPVLRHPPSNQTGHGRARPGHPRFGRRRKTWMNETPDSVAGVRGLELANVVFAKGLK